MSTRHLILCGLLLLASLAPRTHAQQAPEQLIEAGDRLVDSAEYQAAAENYTLAYMSLVSLIRGQDFVAEVTPSLMTRKELAAEMRRQFDLDYTPAEIQHTQATYRALGLVSPSLDLKQTLIDLLTEEVAGFYDPRDKRMVLIRGEDQDQQPGFLGRLLGQKPTFDKEEQKSTLSHELTHALQDQLYGLKDMQESIVDDDDLSMAFTALVEGDATLVMFGEMGRDDSEAGSITDMDPDQAEWMFGLMRSVLPIASGKTYRKAPPIFRDTLIFPYLNGLVFNLHLIRDGGFERIHQAYQNPPVSTEQILHPEKYLTTPDLPRHIDWPGLEKLVPSPWKYLGSNCLGELQLSIVLRPTGKGRSAAAGWDGDRYFTFQDDRNEVALVWYTCWDSREEADEFVAAIDEWNQLATKKHAATQEGIEPASSLSTLFTWSQHENVVILVNGFDADLRTRVLANYGDATLREKTFPLPASISPSPE